MRDILGNTFNKGDRVVFIQQVWDNVTELTEGYISSVVDNRIIIRYTGVSYTWNKETKKHDILNYSSKECSIQYEKVVVIGRE